MLSGMDCSYFHSHLQCTFFMETNPFNFNKIYMLSNVFKGEPKRWILFEFQMTNMLFVLVVIITVSDEIK